MHNKKQRTLIIVLILLAIAFVGSLGWFLVDRFVDRSGWYEQDGVYSYRDFHWKKVTGWQEIDGHYYYFGDDYAMRTDWLELGENRFYLGADGTLDFGWIDVENQRYYAGPDGVLLTGWQVIDGSRYCFNDDGSMYTGWLWLDGKKHHFAQDGAQSIGFYTENDETWFFGDDGTMYTGEHILDGQVYLFSEDGTMYTGWTDTDTGRRYYQADGPMCTGWQTIDSKHYYFDENGAMQTGWLQQGEYSYYLQEDGSAAVGPMVIDGNTHFFTPMGIHVVLVNGTYTVPSYYDTEFIEVEEWKLVSTTCYDALMEMLEDCVAAGNEYYFNSGYRSYAAQEEIMEARTSEHMYEFGLDYNQAYAKARRSVALPGHSEHHLGLAVDLVGENAQKWLAEHCWEYGFILRYTEEKEEITGVMDEPWHFRYVGTKVSMDMKDSGLCLEEYLGAA